MNLKDVLKNKVEELEALGLDIVLVVPTAFDIEYNLLDQEESYRLWLVLNSSDDLSFNFKFVVKDQQSLTLGIYLIPTKNNFSVSLNLNIVAIDQANVQAATDLYVKRSLGKVRDIPEPIKNYLQKYDITKGKASINQHILLFDEAKAFCTPEYNILPAGITQLHGMVIYSLEQAQKYFLYSRGIKMLKDLFIV